MTARLVTVGMDGSASAFRALDAAAAEAQMRRARLDIVYCVQDADEAGPVLRAAGARVARHFPHLPVNLRGPVGDPVDLLARAGRASLLTVVGSRESIGNSALPMRPLGRRLAARCRGPLLIVRGCTERSPRPAGLNPILLAVEADDDTEAAVFAFEEAQLRRIPLRVLLSWTYRPPIPYVTWPHSPCPQPGRRESRNQCPSAQTDRGASGRAGPAHKVGSPAQCPVGCECLVAATASACLVVVAKRRGGHTWNARHLGPVVDVLLRHSQCPVAVVPGPAD